MGANLRMSSHQAIPTIGEAKIKLIPMRDADLGRISVDSPTNSNEIWAEQLYRSPNYVMATVTEFSVSL